MSKRLESNEADVFFVKHHNTLSDKEISAKLNLKISAVRELKASVGQDSVKISKEDVDKALAPIIKGVEGSFYVNKTRSGNRGVTVMTEAASQRVDESRTKLPKTSDRMKKAIHKPFG